MGEQAPKEPPEAVGLSDIKRITEVERNLSSALEKAQWMLGAEEWRKTAKPDDLRALGMLRGLYGNAVQLVNRAKEHEKLRIEYISLYRALRADKKDNERRFKAPKLKALMDLSQSVQIQSAAMCITMVTNAIAECAAALNAVESLFWHVIGASEVSALSPHFHTSTHVRRMLEDANAERQKQAALADAELQRLAAEKWAKPQHKNKSATAIAKLIDPKHWNTTRKKIHKP